MLDQPDEVKAPEFKRSFGQFEHELLAITYGSTGADDPVDEFVLAHRPVRSQDVDGHGNAIHAPEGRTRVCVRDRGELWR